MIKKILSIIVVICFLVPSIVCAEMAPQFKKSSKDNTDLSKNAPQHDRMSKGGDVMENKARAGGDVMENKARAGSDVMENKARVGGDVMENKARVGGNVMENKAKAGGNVME